MKHLKQEFDKLTFKDTLLYALTILSLVAGFVLIFMGLLIPPRGEIHDSVLYAFGLVLLFVGALLGIDLRYSNMTSAFKQTVIDMLKKGEARDCALNEVRGNEVRGSEAINPCLEKGGQP